MAWKVVSDGNDIFAVGRAMKEAINHARSGKGPYLIEFKTYRLAPHHTGDPCVYRKPAEVDAAWKNDPIPRAEKALLNKKWATPEYFKQIASQCDAVITEAVEALLRSPLPDAATVWDHIYAS